MTRAVLVLIVLTACKDDPKGTGAAPSASASITAAASTAAVMPSASASSAPEVQHDCPTGSVGLGSFSKPCEATGKARMIEVAPNGKSDDKGNPFFKVASKSDKPILFGRVAVYFYDKAGAQIDAKETLEGSDKTHSYHACPGALFAGTLGAGEKASYTFSCMKKSNIPDGTVTMEAEAQMVGFADASGKKNDFYWRNKDLTPDVRPKGGAK